MQAESFFESTHVSAEYRKALFLMFLQDLLKRPVALCRGSKESGVRYFTTSAPYSVIRLEFEAVACVPKQLHHFRMSVVKGTDPDYYDCHELQDPDHSVNEAIAGLGKHLTTGEILKRSIELLFPHVPDPGERWFHEYQAFYDNDVVIHIDAFVDKWMKLYSKAYRDCAVDPKAGSLQAAPQST